MIVISYPKSGRTWLIHMLADYYRYLLPHRIFNELGKQYLRDRRLPCSNWVFGFHKIELDKLRDLQSFYGKQTLYLIRDPRDCLPSLYFYRKYAHRLRRKRIRFTLETLLSQRTFVRRTLSEWKQHVETYRNQCDLQVSYEELIQAPCSTLARLTDADDMDRIRTAVESNSFKAHAGRERGSENKRKLARKGITGDWRNHYDTPAFKAIMKEIVGQELIEFGYEEDMNW